MCILYFPLIAIYLRNYHISLLFFFAIPLFHAQDDEPPEICVVEGAFTLQTITPTQPMPSIDELDAKFAELVEELDLTAPNKDAMLSLPPQKKWQIYCSRKIPIDSTDGAQVARNPPTPEHYIERLRDIAKVRTLHFGLCYFCFYLTGTGPFYS